MRRLFLLLCGTASLACAESIGPREEARNDLNIFVPIYAPDSQSRSLPASDLSKPRFTVIEEGLQTRPDGVPSDWPWTTSMDLDPVAFIDRDTDLDTNRGTGGANLFFHANTFHLKATVRLSFRNGGAGDSDTDEKEGSWFFPKDSSWEMRMSLHFQDNCDVSFHSTAYASVINQYPFKDYGLKSDNKSHHVSTPACQQNGGGEGSGSFWIEVCEYAAVFHHNLETDEYTYMYTEFYGCHAEMA